MALSPVGQSVGHLAATTQLLGQPCTSTGGGEATAKRKLGEGQVYGAHWLFWLVVCQWMSMSRGEARWNRCLKGCGLELYSLTASQDDEDCALAGVGGKTFFTSALV
jgi:hypothetical protein